MIFNPSLKIYTGLIIFGAGLLLTSATLDRQKVILSSLIGNWVAVEAQLQGKQPLDGAPKIDQFIYQYQVQGKDYQYLFDFNPKEAKDNLTLLYNDSDPTEVTHQVGWGAITFLFAGVYGFLSLGGLLLFRGFDNFTKGKKI